MIRVLSNSLLLKRMLTIFLAAFITMSITSLMSVTSSMAEELVYQLPTGTMPSYDSYGRGVGIGKINDSYSRDTKTQTGSCSGDYPQHIGARCYRQKVCSKRKKDAYSFDNIATCFRNKKISVGTPSSYNAPSKGESLSCPSGYGLNGGLCYGGCKSGYSISGLRCSNDRNDQCQSNREGSGGLCYLKCRDGYHGDGVNCYADNKNLCTSGKVLRAGLCYEECKTGYDRVGATCTNVGALDRFTKDAAAGFSLVAAEPAVTLTKCASPKSATTIGYCQQATLDVRACGSMFDKSSCFGPGNIVMEVAGSTGLTTYLSAESGEASATFEADQTLTIGLFGAKPITVGVKCQFTKGGATSFSYTFGASMGTPPIPSLAASDALNKIKSQSSSSSSSAKSSTTEPSPAPKVDSKLMKTLKSIPVPCGIIMPNPKLFSGVPSVSLYEVGTTLTFSAENWKIGSSEASVDLIVSAGVVATVGGDTIDVTGLGQTFKTKVPGFGFKKDLTKLISQPLVMSY
jgi:hypothetical protein